MYSNRDSKQLDLCSEINYYGLRIFQEERNQETMQFELSDLNTAEAFAKALGVTTPTASRIIRAGEIDSLSDGRRRLVTRQAIEQYLSAHNLVVAPQDHKRSSSERPALKALSFFSGALGLDLGMEEAGIPSLLYCEQDRKCRMTIQANRPEAALVGDITKLDASTVRAMAGLEESETIDVVFGGPPCQAFSTAGARRAFLDDRGNVFLKYLDLARDLNPTYLVIENVRGLLSASWPIKRGEAPVRGGALFHILDTLNTMGYTVSFELYNAANFGAPQIRERVVLIAKKGGSVAKLVPSHSNDSSWNLKPWVSFSEAVQGLSEKHYIEFPEARSKYLRMLSEGQYWKDLPEEVQAEAMGKSYSLPGGKTGFYRRIWSNRPCPTLVTSPTMPATYLCHPTEIRPLSVEEYKRIQGFPDSWQICGDLNDQYRQIGNAVPIALGRAIGRALLDDISGRAPDRDWGAFPYSRYKKTNEGTWSVG